MKSKVIMKENLLITLCLILLSYGMTGCKDSTRTLLSKSVEMEKISTDSMLFYLQQIQEPNHLTNKQRAEYCFQLYKATLWKTQKPKDSLLKVCIPLFYNMEVQPNGYRLNWNKLTVTFTSTSRILFYMSLHPFKTRKSI